MAIYPFQFGAAGQVPNFSRRRRSVLEREMGGPLSIDYQSPSVEGIPTMTRASSMPIVEGIPLSQSQVRASAYDSPVDFNQMTGGGLLGAQIDIEVPDAPTNLLGMPTTDYRKELKDAKRVGGLEQLSGMLMGLAMPTRRGESRLMKSMMLGKKMGQEAEAEALNRVTAGMKVDEFMREQDLKARRSAILSGQGVQGGAGAQAIDMNELMTNVSYLPEANQQAFAQSLNSMQKANQFMAAGMTEDAQAMMELAQKQRDAAFAGQIDPQKRTELELSSAKDFQKTEYETRYAVVNSFNEMVRQAEQGGGISDYALLIKYIKALDPNSVVREGEVTMTDQFKGFEARLNEALRKAKGKGFDPEFRRSLLQSAQAQALLAKSEYEKAVESKSKLFSLSGLRPERIITSPTLSLLPLPQGSSGPLTQQDRTRVDQVMGVDLDG